MRYFFLLPIHIPQIFTKSTCARHPLSLRSPNARMAWGPAPALCPMRRWEAAWWYTQNEMISDQMIVGLLIVVMLLIVII